MHAPPRRTAFLNHLPQGGSQGTGVRHMAAAAQFFQQAGVALLLARKKKVYQHGPCRRQHLVHGGPSRFPNHHMAGGEIEGHAARPAAHGQPMPVSGAQIPDMGVNAPEPAAQDAGDAYGGVRLQHGLQLRARMNISQLIAGHPNLKDIHFDV